MARFDHDRLRRIRLDLGLSQQEAASTLGITERSYRRYESGAVNQGGPFSVRHASRQRLLYTLCQQFGVEHPDDWLIPDAAPAPAPPTPGPQTSDEAHLEALLAAGQPEAALAAYIGLVGGFAQLGLRRGDWLRGARLLRRFSVADDPARLHAGLSAESRSRLAYDWGLYAGALGDLPGALRAYAACLQHGAAVGDEVRRRRLLSTGHRTTAYTLRLQGALEDAMAAISRSLSLARDGWDHLRGAALRAAILHDLGEVEAAGRAFAAAEAALGGPPVARWGLWHAEHLLERGQAEAARTRTAANLSVCVQRGWPGHAAHCHLVLADAVPAPEAAEQHRQVARAWVEQTGEIELLLRLHLSEARASGQPSAGLVLADAMGAGWFSARLRTV